MKTAMVLLLTLTATGCATSPLSPQPVEEAAVTMSEHLDKVANAEAFCKGKEVKYYFESSISYIFTCEGGRQFTLRK